MRAPSAIRSKMTHPHAGPSGAVNFSFQSFSHCQLFAGKESADVVSRLRHLRPQSSYHHARVERVSFFPVNASVTNDTPTGISTDAPGATSSPISQPGRPWNVITALA